MSQLNLKKYTDEEIEEYCQGDEAEYDEHGNYVLPDGSYFDKLRYFYDQDGYDEQGGYFDDNGNYKIDDHEEDKEADVDYGYKDFDSSSKGISKNYYSYKNQGHIDPKKELNRVKKEVIDLGPNTK